MTPGPVSKASPLSPPLSNPNVKQVLDAVQATMKAEQYCFLITLDNSGQPQARMVAALAIEPDLRVWIVTNPDTRKVKEIQEDDRTTMAFCDNKGEGYATLIGKSRLVNDKEQKRKLWQFSLGAFFPTGPEGKDSTLIEFTPSRIEIMHFHLKIGIYPFDFKPKVLVKEGDAWSLQK